MPKVLHIRDVPDDVHEALTEAAEAAGLSLTRYLHRELGHLARLAQVTGDNAAVLRATQSRIDTAPDRDLVLEVLHEGRRA
jgi:hypothetical protein